MKALYEVWADDTCFARCSKWKYAVIIATAMEDAGKEVEIQTFPCVCTTHKEALKIAKSWLKSRKS